MARQRPETGKRRNISYFPESQMSFGKDMNNMHHQ